MKKAVIFMLVSTNIFFAEAQKILKPVTKTVVVKPTVAKPAFKNLADSFSYAAGYAVATNMKSQNIRRVNAAIMQKAIDDVYKGNQPLIDPAKLNDVLQRQSQVFAQEKSIDDHANAAAEISKGVTFFQG